MFNVQCIAFRLQAILWTAYEHNSYVAVTSLAHVSLEYHIEWAILSKFYLLMTEEYLVEVRSSGYRWAYMIISQRRLS